MFKAALQMPLSRVVIFLSRVATERSELSEAKFKRVTGIG